MGANPVKEFKELERTRKFYKDVDVKSKISDDDFIVTDAICRIVVLQGDIKLAEAIIEHKTCSAYNVGILLATAVVEKRADIIKLIMSHKKYFIDYLYDYLCNDVNLTRAIFTMASLYEDEVMRTEFIGFLLQNGNMCKNLSSDELQRYDSMLGG